MARTLFEASILIVISAALALGANAASSKGLKFTRDYFARKPMPDHEPTTAPPPIKMSEKTQDAQPRKSAAAQAQHPKHNFQTVSTDEAFELWNDPKHRSGLYVFVDARDDEKYAQGHIPGAVQCDHYYLENYIQDVLDRVEGAEKAIIYCNGGTCEDSVLVCQDLLEGDVRYDTIFLYEGGWTDWIARGLPTEKAEEAP